MARAIWKGLVRIGAETVPVKLYAAVEDRRIHFRLLHARDHEPVKQRMVRPDTQEPLEEAHVHRGHEVDKGRYVVLEGEELEQLTPERSRDIEIERCVPRSTLDRVWYQRPYWLGPDGDVQGYFSLARALEHHDAVAVVRWVMRKRDQVGAMLAHRGHLLLMRLHHAGEVVPAEALRRPPVRQGTKEERRLAEQLVGALAGDFEPDQWQPQYEDQLRELISRKAEGREVVPTRATKPRAPTEDLSATLRRSLEGAKTPREARGGERAARGRRTG